MKQKVCKQGIGVANPIEYRTNNNGFLSLI